jgi:hypothetical protein
MARRVGCVVGDVASQSVDVFRYLLDRAATSREALSDVVQERRLELARYRRSPLGIALAIEPVGRQAIAQAI